MLGSPRDAARCCPRCGPLAAGDVVLYGECPPELRLPIAPVAPTCRACGAGVAPLGRVAPSRGRRMVVLTGTCGSGKSTIAALLMARYGYAAIDGDHVIDQVKRRWGKDHGRFNGPTVLAEIARQIDCLLAAERDIALAHMVLVQDLPRYRELCRARGLACRFVALRPDCATALARTQARTCFSGITPAEVVVGFHEALAAFERAPEANVTVLDNAAGTADEAAGRIAALAGG